MNIGNDQIVKSATPSKSLIVNGAFVKNYIDLNLGQKG